MSYIKLFLDMPWYLEIAIGVWIFIIVGMLYKLAIALFNE